LCPRLASKEVRPWTAREDKLLGTKPDPEIARTLGRTLDSVHQRRRKLRILRAPSTQIWKKDELALLGTMPDKRVARLTGRGLPAVRVRRKQLGRAPCNPVWQTWTGEEKVLLGKMSDAEVAHRTGHPAGSVKAVRCKLGIPCFHPGIFRGCRKKMLSWDRFLMKKPHAAPATLSPPCVRAASRAAARSIRSQIVDDGGKNSFGHQL